MRIRSVAHEALASARSAPVPSALTVLIVSAMVLTVLLTTGRTVGAEQRVLSSIDSVGSRAIVVRADPDAGVTTAVLERLQGVDGIQWAGAFSGAVDATNQQIPEGTRVPTRSVYSLQLDQLGIAERKDAGELAFASVAALEQLGLVDGAGAISVSDGRSVGLGGQLVTPEYLAEFEPLVLIPRDISESSEPIAVLVLVAATPELVPTIADFALSVLAPHDSSKVTLQTSDSLAQVKALVQDQLSSFSRSLMLVLLGVTALLVTVILFGLVMMRRKDFGRRRALGASRLLIVELLLVQTAILAGIGSLTGVIAATVTLIVMGDPVPDVGFAAALCLLASVTTVFAALAPAVIASRREPIRELRVP